MFSAQNRIAVVDYGMGNLQSVRKALEHLQLPVVVTSEGAVIRDAAAVILPGVGAFGDAMRELESRQLVDIMRDRAGEAAEGGRPFLGICVGMQLLVEGGEEDPDVPGLGVVKGSCPRLRRNHCKIPHMGWNELRMTREQNPLLEGFDDSAYVYFVHSYEVVPANRGVVSATVDYNGEIAASLWQNNLFATQFHPEKSQANGLRLLENFGRIAQAGNGLAKAE